MVAASAMRVPAPRAPVLHGRGRERAAVDALLARAGAGHGGALLVHGGPGLGKTALLAHAAHAGTGAGFTVLAVGGLRDEHGLPYAALHRLLQPLRQRVVDLPAAAARRLRHLLDDGGPVPTVRLRDSAAAPDLDVARAVLALLDTAAGHRPVLCGVDDFEWLDPASRWVLTFAARRLSRRPVALLATSGTGDPADASGDPVIAGVGGRTLAPLDEAAGRAVLSDLLPEPLPERVVGAVLQLAGGNPQALRELAESLTPAQRAGAAPAPTGLPTDSDLRRRYQHRLRRLPAAARWLLLLAATGPELTAGCLARAARQTGVDITALAPAEQAGLVRVSGDTVSFPQPLLATAVYDAAPLARRRQAHLHVGEAAAALGDYHRAARALAQAAELTCDQGEAAHRLVTAAWYAWQAGQPDRARQLLHRAGPAGTGIEVAAHRRLLAGEIELRTGAPGTVLSALLSVADALGERRRDLAVRALVRAVEAAWFTGDHRRHHEIAARAAALRAADGPAAEQQMLAYVQGFTALFRRRPRQAVTCLREVIELVQRPDAAAAGQDPLEGALPLVLATAASLFLADYQSAQQLAGRAIAAGRSSGHTAGLPLTLELLATAELATGRYETAQATCQAGLRAARATGQPGYAADHLAMLAVLAALRGDQDGCRRWLNEPVVPAATGPGTRPAALRQWALALLDLAADRPGEAATRLTALGDPASGEGQVMVQVLAAPWLAEAVAATGSDRPLAVALLARFAHGGDRAHAGLPRALAARGRGLLAPPGSPLALGYLHTALRLHRTAECELERARTELLLARQLRQQGCSERARHHLQQALATFQGLPAPGWAQRAAAELRAGGWCVPAAPATPAGTEVLTDQQRRIARLVAHGATNREVAAQLFISPRTVDHHLRNIFQRLGVRSRVELARLLA